MPSPDVLRMFSETVASDGVALLVNLERLRCTYEDFSLRWDQGRDSWVCEIGDLVVHATSPSGAVDAMCAAVVRMGVEAIPKKGEVA